TAKAAPYERPAVISQRALNRQTYHTGTHLINVRRGRSLDRHSRDGLKGRPLPRPELADPIYEMASSCHGILVVHLPAAFRRRGALVSECSHSVTESQSSTR